MRRCRLVLPIFAFCVATLCFLNLDEQLKSSALSRFFYAGEIPRVNAVEERPRPCSLDGPVEGEWYLPLREEWPEYPCPLSIDARNDCRFENDTRRRQQWNFTDNEWRFRPKGCLFVGPRSTDELRALLNGRRIWFLGDSLMFNHVSDAACDWQRVLRADRKEKNQYLEMPPFEYWGWNNDDPFSTTLTRGDLYEITLTWPTGRVVLAASHVGCRTFSPMEQALPFLVGRWWSNESTRDVVVLNMGLHWNDYWLGNYTAKMLETVDHLRRQPGSPLFIWRETFPQHFDSADGAFAKELLSFPCRAPPVNDAPPDRVNAAARLPEGSVPLMWQKPHNWFNDVTNRLLKGRLPIMYLHRTSRERWREHHGLYDANDFDCTHYCVPSSVMRFASELLLHHIVLLRP